MKSVIIDICKYLLFALIALGLVAALVGCGDDSENSVPPFSFKPFHQPEQNYLMFHSWAH